MTLIVNSAAGDSIFDINGNAIDNASYKPKLDGGAATNLGGNQTLLDNAPISVDVEATGTGSNVASDDKIIPIDVNNVFENTKTDYLKTTIKGVKTGEAIRNNKWNGYSATFDSNYPEDADETSASNIASDNVETTRITLNNGAIPTQVVK